MGQNLTKLFGFAALPDKSTSDVLRAEGRQADHSQLGTAIATINRPAPAAADPTSKMAHTTSIQLPTETSIEPAEKRLSPKCAPLSNH